IGDKAIDIITAAGPGGGPQVTVFNPLTAQALLNFFAFNSAFTGGVFVTAGDVDAAGKAEIIASAGPAFPTAFPGVAGPAADGLRVSIFNNSGTQQSTFMPYPSSFLGGASVGTVTLKGKVDILTGAGPSGGPEVKAFDGSQTLLA